MTCYNPIRACYSKSDYAKTGKKSIHLVLHENFDDNGNVIKDSKYLVNEKDFPHALYEYINLPCRQCAGCRSDNAKMWSLRAFNELTCHDKNCFITLTYDNASSVVANDPMCIASLRYKHFQNFMKRLRKRFPNSNIGYLVCGEYGIQDGRAHWHAILFGFDFPDKKLVYVKRGFNHYDSEILRQCWSTYDRVNDSYESIGFIDLCNVDYECCAYVAGYVLKKLDVGNVGGVVSHYYDPGSNQIEEIRLAIEGRCPPLIRSSKRPAIGLNWYNKYGKNACEKGFSTVRKGDKIMKIRTPAYYYSKFEQQYPDLYQNIKESREQKMKKYYKLHPLDLAKLNSLVKDIK